MRDRDHWDAHDLFPGVRARMSALGRERHPKYGDRRGVIVSQGSPSSWRVKFDERNTLQAIHRDYLEPVPASPPPISKPSIRRHVVTISQGSIARTGSNMFPSSRRLLMRLVGIPLLFALARLCISATDAVIRRRVGIGACARPRRSQALFGFPCIVIPHAAW
jgi:hypothetical protein